MSKPKIQTDISGLRALSVLMVVLYHFHLRILNGGFIGVDIFFVISGYLMTKIIRDGLERQNFHYGIFLLKRALRIFPALFAVVLALLVGGALLLPPPDLAALSQQCVRAILFVSNTYYASQQGYFADGLDNRWLLHTWSLSVEWQFYMLYPAIIWLGLKLSRPAGRRAPLAFAGFLLAVAAASLILCVAVDYQSAFFSVATRSWQMIAGGLVFLARDPARIGGPRGAVLSYAGLAVICFGAYLVAALRLEQQWPGYYAVIPVVGACLVLAAGYEGNPLLNNPVMQRLGAWSYSIYLWHWPVVIAMGITGLLAEAPSVAKLVGVPLSIALGYLSFRYIEPARALRAARVTRGALALGAGGGALVAMAAAFAISGGLPMRTDQPAVFEAVSAAALADTYPPACENIGAEKGHTCRLNPGAAGPRVLVIGDSHAGHLYPWFKRHGKNDTTFYVKSGCPLIIGFERVGRDNHCREFSEAAYRLAASGAYERVIVSQNWTFFSPSSNGICSYQAGQCVTPPASDRPALPVAQTRATLQNLLDHQVAVTVVDSTPHFTFNVPNRISRNLYWHGTITERADSIGMGANNAAYDKLFAELARQRRFSLLSLRGDLCEADRCAIYDRRLQIPIFKDMDHLNPAWLVENGQQFERLLAADAVAARATAPPPRAN
nr:acyltransferase family protein [uncultured Duganella sp.]